jgi:osmoprotectant transport system permease protein
VTDERLLDSLIANTIQHLKLTLIALAAAVVTGVGLSLLVFRLSLLARAVTYVAGLLQTIPSIALLALMIPVFGIGMWPAIVALFLYSLLPILRNSLTALTTIDPTLIRVAVAMGLSDREQIRYLFVPLSLPSMLAGIRTAAVISIGTATLAAFIGAGGLGEPIVTGLALNDAGLILQGAIPAAGLALLTELLFEGIERMVLPGHLRH